jgi:hypothetical protein
LLRQSFALFDLCEFSLLGQIGGNDFDAATGFGRQLPGKRVEFFLIASDDDEVITATGEPVRVDRANAG